jgi:hypothetical protein
MADYDRDLVATIAEAVSAYVSDAKPDDVALEVLTDLQADGWEIRHPNDADGGAFEPPSTTATTEPRRPPARPWDFFRYRRRGLGG